MRTSLFNIPKKFPITSSDRFILKESVKTPRANTKKSISILVFKLFLFFSLTLLFISFIFHFIFFIYNI